ncbi:MAG: hypothetical protein H0U55_16700 [Rubrobacteraceae bacterium]|nr:hypothetical protein [Rubrobacteraceae bacterium]
MSLYPGAPRLDQGKQKLDDTALQDSMARAIEDAMNQLSVQLKGTPLPAVGRDDRRLLFVAISRGVLKYLRDHQVSISAGQSPQNPHTHGVNLNVTMDHYDPKP